MRADADNLAVLFCGQGVGHRWRARARRGGRAPICSSSPPSSSATIRSPGPPRRRASRSRSIYCAQIARFERLGRPAAALHAGHSLGELAALATAGAVDDRDGLRLAVERGRLMDAAAEQRARRDARGRRAIAATRWRSSSTAASRSPTRTRPGSSCSAGRSTASTAPRSRRAPARPAREAARGRGRLSLAADAAGRRRFSQAHLAGVEFRAPRRLGDLGRDGARRSAPIPARCSPTALISPVRWVDVLRAPARRRRAPLPRRRPRQGRRGSRAPDARRGRGRSPAKEPSPMSSLSTAEPRVESPATARARRRGRGSPRSPRRSRSGVVTSAEIGARLGVDDGLDRVAHRDPRAPPRRRRTRRSPTLPRPAAERALEARRRRRRRPRPGPGRDLDGRRAACPTAAPLVAGAIGAERAGDRSTSAPPAPASSRRSTSRGRRDRVRARRARARDRRGADEQRARSRRPPHRRALRRRCRRRRRRHRGGRGGDRTRSGCAPTAPLAACHRLARGEPRAHGRPGDLPQRGRAAQRDHARGRRGGRARARRDRSLRLPPGQRPHPDGGRRAPRA